MLLGTYALMGLDYYAHLLIYISYVMYFDIGVQWYILHLIYTLVH